MPVKQCLKCGEINMPEALNCGNCSFPLAESPLITGENITASVEAIPRKIPEGIRGWLIVVMIALILSILRVFGTLLNSYVPLFSSDILKELTTPGHSYYSRLWIPFISFEAIGNLIMGVTCIAALILMFMKKRIFPKLMIAFYCFNFLFLVADTIFLMQLNVSETNPLYQQGSQIGGQLISCSIWIPYFLLSKRVRNTFVN